MNHMQGHHTMDWTRKIHTERWYCDLEHTEPREYDDKDGFVSHLKIEHGHQLTPSQLQGRARRNKMVAKRDLFVCPLCDCVPDDLKDRVTERPYKLLWRHICQHLKALSLLSLSYLEFEIGSSESVQFSESTRHGEEDDLSQFSDEKSVIRDIELQSNDNERPVFGDEDLVPKTKPTELITDGAKIRDLANQPILPDEGSQGWKFLPTKEMNTDYESLRQRLSQFVVHVDNLRDEDFENTSSLCFFYLAEPYIFAQRPWTCGKTRDQMSGIVNHTVTDHGLVKSRHPLRFSQRYLTRCASHDPGVKEKLECERCENIYGWTETELTEETHAGEAVCLRCYSVLPAKMDLFQHLKDPKICEYNVEWPIERKMRILYSTFISPHAAPKFYPPPGKIIMM